jgi:uncharacterized protein (TIGR04255 family)
MSLFDVKVSDLPSKIEYKCLLNAIIEVRFSSTKPAEMIVWPLYEALKDQFKVPEITSIGRVPREVRNNLDLKEQILYTMTSNDRLYTVGVGDGIFQMNLGNFNYSTWDNFVKQFQIVNDIIQKDINKVTRVGVRYINIFNAPDSNVKNFTFDCKLKNKSLFDYSLQSVFEAPIDERIARISIVNHVKYKYYDGNGVPQIGGDNALALDIDVVYNRDLNNDNILDVINYSHLSVKKIFFSMCTEKFKKNVLKPQKEKN